MAPMRVLEEVGVLSFLLARLAVKASTSREPFYKGSAYGALTRSYGFVTTFGTLARARLAA